MKISVEIILVDLFEIKDGQEKLFLTSGFTCTLALQDVDGVFPSVLCHTFTPRAKMERGTDVERSEC